MTPTRSAILERLARMGGHISAALGLIYDRQGSLPSSLPEILDDVDRDLQALRGMLGQEVPAAKPGDKVPYSTCPACCRRIQVQEGRLRAHGVRPASWAGWANNCPGSGQMVGPGPGEAGR